MAKEKKNAVSIDNMDVKIDGKLVGEVETVSVEMNQSTDEKAVLSRKTRVVRKSNRKFTFTCKLIKLIDPSITIKDLYDREFLLEGIQVNPITGESITLVIPNCDISTHKIDLGEDSAEDISGPCGEWYEKN